MPAGPAHPNTSRTRPLLPLPLRVPFPQHRHLLPALQIIQGEAASTPDIRRTRAPGAWSRPAGRAGRRPHSPLLLLLLLLLCLLLCLLLLLCREPRRLLLRLCLLLRLRHRRRTPREA